MFKQEKHLKKKLKNLEKILISIEENGNFKMVFGMKIGSNWIRRRWMEGRTGNSVYLLLR